MIDQVSQVVKGGNGLGITKAYRDELEKKIELPYLQLVMEYLWKKAGSNGFCGSTILKGSATVHRTSNQQIMKPVIMVAKAIKIGEGRYPCRIF